MLSGICLNGFTLSTGGNDGRLQANNARDFLSFWRVYEPAFDPSSTREPVDLLGAQAMKTSELTGPAPAQHGADTTKLIEMLYRWDLDKGRWEYWFENAWIPYEELGE